MSFHIMQSHDIHSKDGLLHHSQLFNNFVVFLSSIFVSPSYFFILVLNIL